MPILKFVVSKWMLIILMRFLVTWILISRRIPSNFKDGTIRYPLNGVVGSKQLLSSHYQTFLLES